MNYEQIMADISQPSKYSKAQFMDKCPAIMPECEEELNWWEEWLENHPSEKADMDIAFYEFIKHQAAKFSWFKIVLRIFLQEHSMRGIGDFYLHVNDKQITIRPVCPMGENKEFKFKL